MTAAWIILSTRWEFANVQAGLNVVISILGTVGIWALSRLWWQRGIKRVLDKQGNIPLSELFTFTSAGDSWDVMMLLGKQLFSKENWHLLLQLIIVVTVTLATIFAGPIARFSLRSGFVVRPKELSVLQASKGAGPFLNLVTANNLWNETINSLDLAGFPPDQLMDYVPASTEPWIYHEGEWDPTWRISCNNTDETEIPNMVASGNYSLQDPESAFPAFRNSLNPEFRNTTRYRSNFDSVGFVNPSEVPQVKRFIYIFLYQTDPRIGDQMYLNANPLEISLTMLYLQDMELDPRYKSFSGLAAYVPVGRVGNATFTRSDCLLTRKALVEDETRVPWPWTNITASITRAYADFYRHPFTVAAANKAIFKPRPPKEIIRFYQVYMASISTMSGTTTLKQVSVRLDTVELSIITLIVLALILLWILWVATRFFIFYWKNKRRIEEKYIPDAKIEWMVHAAKCLPPDVVEESQSDRGHFRNARFGDSGLEEQRPKLARVFSPKQAAPATRLTQSLDLHRERSGSSTIKLSNPSSPISPTNTFKSTRSFGFDESIQRVETADVTEYDQKA